MKEDIDKLQAAAKSVKGLVAVGEKVMKDGKVNLADIQHAPELAEHLGDLVEARKHYKEMVAEGKDIDPLEAVQLLQTILG